jgi:hypothetical protein
MKMLGWGIFLTKIQLRIKPTPSIFMHCDCQATIAIAKNKYFNGKNWHIRFRYDVVKQLLEDEIISIDYVKSEINLADPLTKPLGKKMILETSREMRLMLKWEIKIMVTQPMWIEIPWIRFIGVITKLFVIL